MTVWHWIRHAPTHQKSFTGWRDVPADLSDSDRIAQLSAALPQDALLVTSDLARSHCTGDALSHPHRRKMPPQPGLREFHFGRWEGLNFEKVSDRDPALSRTYWEQPGDILAPEGESWNMAAHRANTVVDHFNSRFPDAQIIAVAHFGIILTQVQRALGVPAQEVLAHSIDNLSLTRISWSAGHAEIGCINHHP